MGTKNAPLGFGVWIAFQKSIGTVERSIQLLKDVGAQWVAPRAGEHTWRDERWSHAEAIADIKKYHDAGLKVYPWVYSHPNTCMQEVAFFKQLMDEGADGIIIDAEVEWQTAAGNGPLAEQFLKALRAALGDDAFIGHAPFPYVLYHSAFPYAEFGKYCDQVHPQTYWSEISDAGAEHHVLATQAQWDTYVKRRPEIEGAAGQVCHIGVTYGKEIGGPTPGTFRPSDLKWFMDWCKSKQLVAWSVYSLDAMNHQAYLTLKAINDGTDIPQDAPGTGVHTSGLQGGDSGDRVKALQEKLNGMGYSLTADGVFGQGTKAAVQDFQKKHNMQQTGVWGPECDTAAAILPTPVAVPAAPVTTQPTVVSAPVVQPVQPAPTPIAPVRNRLAVPQLSPFGLFSIAWKVIVFFFNLVVKRK